MWLATKQGFFSIVRSDINDSFVIRARAQKDLNNLKQSIPCLNKRKIREYDGSDYPCRIFIAQNELNELFQFFSEDIDYSNFKGKIQTIKNQKDKLQAYHEIWAIMFSYGERIRSRFFNWYK